MNTKKKIIIALASLVVIALAITAYIVSTNQKDNTNPIAPGSPTISQNASPGAKPEIIKAEVPEPKVDDKKQLEAVTAVENFSQEDVKTVIQLSSDYAYNSLSNGYYLSGQWDKDGNPNDLDAAVGRFFTENVRESIKKIDTNPATSKTLGTDVFPLVFFMRPNENITPNAACYSTDVKTVSQFSCPIDGVQVSNITYVPTLSGETPGIKTTFSATAKIPVKIDGDKDGSTEVTYQYSLNFINNEKIDPDTNPNRFVINDYKVDIKINAVVSV